MLVVYIENTQNVFTEYCEGVIELVTIKLLHLCFSIIIELML